jgi:hypothetical protein
VTDEELCACLGVERLREGPPAPRYAALCAKFRRTNQERHIRGFTHRQQEVLGRVFREETAAWYRQHPIE